MATSTEVIDAETMLSKIQIAFLMAYYQYDVSLASLLATCGVPETFGNTVVQERRKILYFLLMNRGILQ